MQRSADFWAVPGMAQMADFIFSGIFGPFREWPKMARILFFPGFLGRSGNGPKWLFFPGFLGRSGNGAKWRGFYFFRDFGPFREWPKMVIFSGFLGRSANGAKWRGIYYFRDFWAVPGMAQFITFSHRRFLYHHCECWKNSY